ncbi:hypothetical protein [Deinococcus sp. RIT780]|uniref:hypothetical protein n=1 Tax=Deinococcus sp. RIT780 TaxID=2870472 RepID=UPI001C89EE3C|nr:hypothetical protein [Deinococcus sp. RIT780]MBX8464425.1 hypothetical protein [Deinococcus sp. RIT780]
MMYVLMDIERLIHGLPSLLPYERPNETEGGYLWWVLDRRHFRLTTSTDEWRSALQWLVSPRAPEWIPGEGGPPNVFFFTLGRPDIHRSDVTVEFMDEAQQLLSSAIRDHFVIAQICFDGAKHDSALRSSHPAWPVIRAFLEATQPVHAVVLGDVYAAEPGQLCLPDITTMVADSTFIGPEQRAVLPKHAFQGFAQCEPVGKGVWLTLPDEDVSCGARPAETNDPGVRQRHWEATQALSWQLADVWSLAPWP